MGGIAADEPPQNQSPPLWPRSPEAEISGKSSKFCLFFRTTIETLRKTLPETVETFSSSALRTRNGSSFDKMVHIFDFFRKFCVRKVSGRPVDNHLQRRYRLPSLEKSNFRLLWFKILKFANTTFRAENCSTPRRTACIFAASDCRLVDPILF